MKTHRQPIPTRITMTSEEQRRLIAEEAYYRAEQRGFVPGSEEQDWLEAEKDVTARIEHRYGSRQPLSEPIVATLYNTGQFLGEGIIRNVARHGVFIRTEAPGDPDTYVQVEFCIPHEGKTYRLWGRITHRQNEGIGLTLDVLNLQTLAALRAVIRQAEKGPQALEAA